MFKKVSNAYSVLINKDKKDHYDRFGPEEDHPNPANRRGHPQQDQEFDDMDDIFKAFFGGVAGHTMNRRGGGNFRS